MTTVDDILADVKRSGYTVRSILGRRDGNWWCCLANEADTATDGAEGETIHEALQTALKLIRKSSPQQSDKVDKKKSIFD